MRFFSLFFLFLSSLALGLPETDLARDYAKLVTPLFSLGTPGTIAGKAGVPLRYRAFPRGEGKGVIVLVPGYSESLVKYQETIYDLWSAGYSVYAMDHRGMGLSGRWLSNPQVVDIDRFEYYVDDLQKFIDDVVSRDALADKKYVVSHSTGGLIVAHLMARRPFLFRGVVLNAPLLDIKTGKYSRTAAVALANTLTAVGRGKHYAPGSGDHDPKTYTLEASTTTQSRVRFDLYKHQLDTIPAIRQGGPSVAWVRTILRETRSGRVEALGNRMRTPILMLQMGVDAYVHARGQNLFCGAAVDCRKLIFPSAKHEIFREKDEYRAPAMRAVLDFLSSH